MALDSRPCTIRVLFCMRTVHRLIIVRGRTFRKVPAGLTDEWIRRRREAKEKKPRKLHAAGQPRFRRSDWLERRHMRRFKDRKETGPPMHLAHNKSQSQ